ncbi:MAG TPA: LiaF domain-containing protein, partial [Bacteroidales bacterium]|nr:LiaF domain-containing protein [Bacteroidales bacterium]
MKKLFLLGIPLLGLLMGFTADQKMKEVKKAIVLGDIRVLNTKVDFPVGNLHISTDAIRPVKGVFQYRKKEWEPEIKYHQEDREGYLKMDSDIDVSFDVDSRNYDFDESDQNNWKVVFPQDLRHDMEVRMLAGNADIDMEESRLDEFEFSLTAGEAKINLRNTSVPEVEVKALAGDVKIDLSGVWRNDLQADIRGGVGSISLRLPSDVGVELEVSGILGGVSAPKMKRDGRRYTNDL